MNYLKSEPKSTTCEISELYTIERHVQMWKDQRSSSTPQTMSSFLWENRVPGSASAELNIENVQSAVENVGGPIGNDLDTFMRSNTHKIEAGRVQCDICFKITAHAGNMKQHFVTHHYQEEAALPCQYCGRHFKNKNSLSSHISQSHKGPKSHLHPWQ